MAELHDLRDARRKHPKPLNSQSFSEFEGKSVPKVNWIIPGVLVEGGVTLFSGQGGKGKSLLCMQLQAALALGTDWLGIETTREPICSFALYCEDENEVLHARMDAIRSYYGKSFSDLELARFKSRVGMMNEIMRFYGRKEEGEVTELYRQLEDEIDLWGYRVLIIDTIADAFGGNENIRAQVRSFVNAMRRLMLKVRGGIILNAHPSRAGLSDGSGLSGSTAWENSVRSRINLTEPKKADDDDETEQASTPERVLKVMKNNYGAAGTKWKLRWKDGVFIRTDIEVPASIVDQLDANAKLLKAAEYLVANGTMPLATHNAKNALIVLALKLPSCRTFSWNALRTAQDRLIEDGRLARVELGPRSRRAVYLRPAGMKLPGETTGEDNAAGGTLI